MSFAVSSPLPFLISLSFAAVSGFLRVRPRSRSALARGIASRAAAPVFAFALVVVYWAFWGWLETLALTPAVLSLWPTPEPTEGAGGKSSWIDRSFVAPIAAGLMTACAAWSTWGFAADPPGIVHDENAYRLQAGIFAEGRWADPPPPLPLFFDQMHVLSGPVRAAKYPPGHALVLTPGFLVGLPVVMPLALDFLAGALLFGLSRRLAGGGVALVAWTAWLTAPGCLEFRSSYFSELTTQALWLAGWWALWKWRETGNGHWLSAFALCVGWGAITRPYTTIAFVLPAGVYVLARAIRGSVRALVAAMLVGGLPLLLWPLWSVKTTGDVRVNPVSRYTMDVIPWDRLGLGLRDQPPLVEVPPDVSGSYAQKFRNLHSRHTLGNLPAILGLRLTKVMRDIWGPWGEPLFAFALLGGFLAPAPAYIGLASAGLLIALHLAYAHTANWSLYYLEGYGVFAFLTGLGLVRGWEWLASRFRAPHLSQAGPWLVAAAIGIGAAPNLANARSNYEEGSASYRQFRSALQALDSRPAVVFVRYSERHDPHRSLVVNGPRLEVARLWVVYDRGARNAEVLRIAPERTPYLYDEKHGALVPLPRADAPDQRPAAGAGPARPI